MDAESQRCDYPNAFPGSLVNTWLHFIFHDQERVLGPPCVCLQYSTVLYRYFCEVHSPTYVIAWLRLTTNDVKSCEANVQ